MIKRDWKPVHRGTIYCSSACGGRCTWAAYKNADAKAKALAKRMGEGWNAHVWENLGWHWEVEKGVMSVMLYDKTYTCYLNTTPQFITRHTNPKTAVSNAIKELDTHLANLQKQRDALNP